MQILHFIISASQFVNGIWAMMKFVSMFAHNELFSGPSDACFRSMFYLGNFL